MKILNENIFIRKFLFGTETSGSLSSGSEKRALIGTQVWRALQPRALLPLVIQVLVQSIDFRIHGISYTV